MPNPISEATMKCSDCASQSYSILYQNSNRFHLSETELAAITEPSQLEGYVFTGKQANELLARIGHKLYKFISQQPIDETEAVKKEARQFIR